MALRLKIDYNVFMIRLPHNAKKLEFQNSTVDFFEFEQDEFTYYYFDCSFCSAPEPMINAMIGLRLIDDSNKKLVMINHSEPSGLFPKIKENYNFNVTELDDGNVQIIFSYKAGTTPQTDFEDNHCNG